jgi:molecular chaperone GrpE
MKKTVVNIDNQKNIEVENLKKNIVDLESQLVEVTNRWKVALADYQNLEKREREDKLNFIKYASKSFIEKILPVVDTLESLHVHLKDQGLELALKELHKILKESGVEKIIVKDKDFDINLMEAVTMTEGEEDNKVFNEVRCGYLMHGAVLRPARVIVSKKTLNPKP